MTKIKTLSFLMVLALVGLLLTLQGPGVAQSKAPLGITVTIPVETTEPPTAPPQTTEPPSPPPVTTEPPATTEPPSPPPGTQRPVVELPDPEGPTTLPATGVSGISLWEEYFSGLGGFTLPFAVPSHLGGFFLAGVLMIVPSRFSFRSKLTAAVLILLLTLALTTLGQPGALDTVRAEAMMRTPDKSHVTRIEIPSIGLTTSVQRAPIKGNSWNINRLGNQVGWLEDTALPGQQGNTVLAGHLTLDQSQAGPFRHLIYLQPGQEIQVYTGKRVYTYKVVDQLVTRPKNFDVFEQTDESLLTLVTCSHWNAKSESYKYRRLVFAELVKVRPLPARYNHTP